ncbi:MAG TPA: hypothetical protein VJ323_04570 [Bryobacteraceae bacterium]|nr:hypothetical protein [Bryobacteraceae bacterium]
MANLMATSRFLLPPSLAASSAPFRQPSIAPACSTGSPMVDRLTGGIPRATLTEICGAASSGRTSLLWSLLRHSTGSGEFCVVVDVQNTFDPVSAANAGIELTRLLWVRCSGNVEHALKATDLLVRAGGFGVVILDLFDTPSRLTRRIPLTSWFRLRHGAEQSGAALVVTDKQIQASSCSRLQIEVRQEHPLWSAKLLQGLTAVAGLRKRNLQPAALFQIVR